MKNKISKILGVALTVVMLASMFVFATPVAAQAYTPNLWNTMSIPSATGQVIRAADVSDFAVASDGKTIYAVSIQATAAILKSTNSGKTWAVLANPAAPFTAPARLVAVSPDNPSVVAIVDSTAADRAFFSSNGGATWADLGAPAAAAQNIYDIAISPANATALLGRNIVVATADPAGAAAYGDIYLIGATATWTAVWTTLLGIASVYDFTSVAFEPNWLGGQCVVAIGSGAAGTGTFFQVIRTAPLAPAVVANFSMAVTGAIGPALGPNEVGAGTPIISSTLALPSDFDSTAPPAIQAYVGINSGVASGDDVYRQDFNQTRKLQIAADVAIYSISFTGTRAGGTLFAGESTATLGPWYSSNPHTALPSWSFSYKAPTGATNVIVQVAPDFATSNTVYAGTTGTPDSAFSRSTNGGVSYNQLSLIDTTIVALEDVMPAPDNSVVFLSTNDGANSSLWRSTTPPSVGTWERVRLRATAGFIIRLSPDYLTDKTLYWCDAGATDIQLSNTGGEVFSTRTAGAALTDLAVESKDIVYMANAGNVFKSTNGAWFFGLPIASQTAGVYSLAMAPTYPDKPKAGNVLVGGVGGGVSLSTDGGASFFPLSASVASGNMQVVADKGYATNNLVYAGSDTAGEGAYRFEVGKSTAWEQIRPVAGSMTGLAMESGVLYGAWSVAVPGVGPVAADAWSWTEDGIAGNDTGTLTVLAGSVTAFTGNAADTIGGVGLNVPRTITPALGAQAIILFGSAGRTLTITAASANSSGQWTRTAGTLNAGIAVDTDLDAFVAPVGGAWSLPDALGAGAPGAVGSGVERSLAPFVPDIASLIFDTMNVGAAAATFNAAPSALRVGGTATDTWLWAINTAAPSLIAYDDTMAKAVLTVTAPATVVADPASGGNAAFTISWNKVSNAFVYEMEIYSDAALTNYVTGVAYPAGYVPGDPFSPAWVVGRNTLPSGAKYYVQVRVRDQAVWDAIRSPWSKAVSFTVQAGTPVEMPSVGPTLLSPQSGDMAVPLRPGFSWTPMPGATEYEFILATDAALTKTVAGTPAKLASPSFSLTADLEYATTYFFAVKVTAPTTSPQSIGSFTTMAKPAPPVGPPVVTLPTPTPITPAWIWAIVIIGAILVIAVVVLIVTTRRTP